MEHVLGWIYILLAGVLEVFFTTGIRYSEGFTKLVPTAFVLILAAGSFYLIAKATDTVPLGTAYAAWGALGSAGTAIIGILFFAEPVTFWRMLFLVTLIGSVVGLKLVSEH
jgi:quaternary ammonium compound-resistance protein SugE